LAEAAGARVALSRHWEKGGDGALEFADAVVDAPNSKRYRPGMAWIPQGTRPRSSGNRFATMETWVAVPVEVGPDGDDGEVHQEHLRRVGGRAAGHGNGRLVGARQQAVPRCIRARWFATGSCRRPRPG
jgi:hypothetical protein